MVRMGIWAPRSAMKSNPPVPTIGSRARAQNSRIFGSMAATLRGVNTRERSPRWRSCSGGSSKMIVPGGISMPLLISSSTVPRLETVGPPVDRAALDVVEAAQGVEVVALVVVDGASSRSLAQTGYGSASISKS